MRTGAAAAIKRGDERATVLANGGGEAAARTSVARVAGNPREAANSLAHAWLNVVAVRGVWGRSEGISYLRLLYPRATTLLI